MEPTIQDVDVDVNSTYDVAASAVDENNEPVALKNLTLVVVDGTGADVGSDDNPEDASDDITINDQVNAVTLITASAMDDNGGKWVAIARLTNREEVPGEDRQMSLTFTKRSA